MCGGRGEGRKEGGRKRGRGALQRMKQVTGNAMEATALLGPTYMDVSPFLAFAPPLPRFNTLQPSLPLPNRPPWREAAYFKVPFRPISDLDKHELAHDYTLCSAILTRGSRLRRQPFASKRATLVVCRCRVKIATLFAPRFTTTPSYVSLLLGTDGCDRVV